ncbi:MAG: hypothetical protein ACJ78Q_16575, partial [Chloroflexia bacterium]
MSSPNPDPAEDELYSVSAVSSTDVWAVGYYNTTVSSLRYSQTLVEHWNGVQWSVVPSQNVNPIQNNHLYDVSALASNDIWAVG